MNEYIPASHRYPGAIDCPHLSGGKCADIDYPTNCEKCEGIRAIRLSSPPPDREESSEFVKKAMSSYYAVMTNDDARPLPRAGSGPSPVGYFDDATLDMVTFPLEGREDSPEAILASIDSIIKDLEELRRRIVNELRNTVRTIDGGGHTIIIGADNGGWH